MIQFFNLLQGQKEHRSHRPSLLSSALVSGFFLVAGLIGCSYRPVVDENEKVTQVGRAQAERDIDDCLAKADDYLSSHKSDRLAKEMGRGAAAGAIFGGVIGAVSGGGLRSAVGGAAIGGAVGGVGRGAGVAAEDKLSPDGMKQRYVENCLARRQYQVIGWK